jgi:hypothetical protein
MNTYLALLILLFFSYNTFAQVERNRYQTMKSTMKISAMKNGENYVWENKNIHLVLDYKVGNLQVKMVNRDFVNVNEAPDSPIDSLGWELEYTLQGIIPINDIIQQLVIKRDYVVELNIINRELGLNHPVQFTLTVTNPGTTQQNYRLFSMRGRMYNSVLRFPALEGFDDEIEVWIGWTAYSIIH